MDTLLSKCIFDLLINNHNVGGLNNEIESTKPQLKQADVSGQFADLLKALDKIDAGNYGSAKNFIERYINSANCL